MTKLEKIKARLAALLVELSVVKTDKAVLEYDGEDLVAGMNVFVTNEDGERISAENGEYVTEDGKVITVENGQVASVVDPVAEVDAEETPIAEEEEVKEEETKEEEEVKPEETVEEIAEEVKEEEPIDEPAKEEEVVAEEAENAEGETEQTEIEKLREEVNELYKLVDSILEKIGESRREADERFEKLEKMSAAAPAEEAFNKTITTTSTGDATIDKKLARAREMGKDWK